MPLAGATDYLNYRRHPLWLNESNGYMHQARDGGRQVSARNDRILFFSIDLFYRHRRWESVLVESPKSVVYIDPGFS